MFIKNMFFTLLFLGVAIFFNKGADCSALRPGAASNDLLASSDDVVLSDTSISNVLRRLLKSPAHALYNELPANSMSSFTADEDMMNYEGEIIEAPVLNRIISSLMRYIPTPITNFIKKSYFLRVVVLTTARFLIYFSSILPNPITAVCRYLVRSLS